ncbi:MAG: PilZ domain-containing protein [Syntrophomonadaceae bacterium]|nr:PilZ domain-containing protein [Syntrophomonadaceae bacterium]
MLGLLVFSLLFVAASSLFYRAEAAAFPLVFGATWEYSEFTEAFRNYLYSRNPLFAYLFVALALVLVALLVREIIRTRRDAGIEESISPAGNKTDDNGDKPVQRRAWARVQSSLDCYFVISRESAEDTGSGSTHTPKAKLRGVILDISGGGCKIATPHQLQVGDELELFLELEPRRRWALKCQVVRVEKQANDDQMYAGIMFKDISEAVRDQIISWTFKHQQSLLEGQRRLAEGRCLRCGKPLSEAMRQESVFCSKCERVQKRDRREYSFS